LLQQQSPTTMTDTFRPSVDSVRQTSTRTRSNMPDEQGRFAKTPMSLRSFGSSRYTTESAGATPRAYPPRAQSSLAARPPSTLGKRTGTAAHEYLKRHEPPATLWGGHRHRTDLGAMRQEGDDFDLVTRDDGDDPDDSFEGMENVRGEYRF
jgi:hypothetical protein